MSKQQWGHGYYTGLRAAQQKMNEEKIPLDFPVGYCFHIRDDKGIINKQGLVISKNNDIYLVRFFSWVDGNMSYRVYPFKLEEMEKWDWYESDEDMNKQYEREAHKVAIEQMESRGWDSVAAERALKILHGELPE